VVAVSILVEVDHILHTLLDLVLAEHMGNLRTRYYYYYYYYHWFDNCCLRVDHNLEVVRSFAEEVGVDCKVVEKGDGGCRSSVVEGIGCIDCFAGIGCLGGTDYFEERMPW
jgi:hypothetical protein